MSRWLLIMLLIPLLASCTSIGYYTQALHGHFTVLSQARPVSDVLAEGREQPAVLSKLRLSQAALAFADAELHLAPAGSYRSYADVGRPYVVWNVVATPELSVEPRRWCFPWLGCVAYRGYFDREEAEAEARALRAQGYETYVAGAQAYSTLGWFDDPIVSPMIQRGDDDFVGTLFHELAHRKLYIADDSAFNEAFAVALANEGVRRWNAAHGDNLRYVSYLEGEQREAEFHALLTRTRERLAALYASELDLEAKREAKAAVFAGLRSEYATLKSRWGGYAGYDRWMGQALNNAHLALSATYYALVPAFEALLAEEQGDLSRFFARAAEFGALPHAERHRLLALLLERKRPGAVLTAGRR